MSEEQTTATATVTSPAPIVVAPSTEPVFKKSGFQTVEFTAMITGILVPVISIFVMMGRLTPDQGDNISAALTTGLTSLAIGITSIVPVIMFIYSRIKVKQHLIMGMQNGLNVKNMNI